MLLSFLAVWRAFPTNDISTRLMITCPLLLAEIAAMFPLLPWLAQESYPAGVPHKSLIRSSSHCLWYSLKRFYNAIFSNLNYKIRSKK